LRPLAESGTVAALLGRMQDSEFIELLRALAAESEQLLNVVDLGGPATAFRTLRETTRGVLAHIASLLGASHGYVWLREPDGGLRCIVGHPERSEKPPGHDVLRCLDTGAVARDHQALCVPLPNREYQMFAAAEMKTGSASESSEHAFRDFARPLGLLTEAYYRLESEV